MRVGAMQATVFSTKTVAVQWLRKTETLMFDVAMD